MNILLKYVFFYGPTYGECFENLRIIKFGCKTFFQIKFEWNEKQVMQFFLFFLTVLNEFIIVMNGQLPMLDTSGQH